MSLLSQRNLAGGELAPALYSRVDTVKYQTGVKTARNYNVIRSGGMQNRAGLKFVGEVKYRGVASEALTVRLIPFVFNTDQTYMLEFGNLYMRVIQNGAYVLNGTIRTITAISQANQGLVTSVGHGYSNGDEIYIYDVDGMIELNGQNFIVSDAAADTFKLKYLDDTYVSTLAFGAYTANGSIQKIYEIVTALADTDLMNMQYSQSADEIVLVGHNTFPQVLTRTDHNAWTLADIDMLPDQAAPTGANWTGTAGAPTFNTRYEITAVSDFGEESFPGLTPNFLGPQEPTASAPHNVTWTAPSGDAPAYYNIYRVRAGSTGYVGSSTSTSFSNTGTTPDFTRTPPAVDLDLTIAERHIRPACVTFAQQRLIFGNIRYFNVIYQTEEVRTSRVGFPFNHTKTTPAQSGDGIQFRLTGRQVNEIRHILDLNKLVILTAGGEYTAEGGQSGALTPFDINIRQYSYNGASKRSPIVIDANALYVQDRGSIVRDMGYDYAVDGYRGNDLTVFSTHLFDGYEIVDWAYQKTPNSVVWAVRDDGILLSLTYLREHQIWGWTRHDTDGLVERVSVIPEGLEDSVYVVVKRTIAGRIARYVERINTRFVDDPLDMIFMDSALTYDGRNTDAAHTMKVTSLSGWTNDSQQALESSAVFFTASSVGEKIRLIDANGDLCIFTIESLFDSQNAIVRADRTVPEAMRAVFLTTWTRAVRTIKGLRHIEGKTVSVFADANVIASPNNPDVTTYTVANGQVTLDDCYGVIHVGLPYICDIETLSIDNPGGESVIDKKMAINKVFVHVEKTRGLFAGTAPVAADADTAIDGLVEFKVRELEDYDDPTALLDGFMDVVTESTYNNHGRVFLRQIDPLPATIIAIHPAGEIPFK